MFVFKRKTLVRLTRLMLSFYIMFYYMSFTVCAEENPVSDMMVSQAIGMMNQSEQSLNITDPVDIVTDQNTQIIINGTNETLDLPQEADNENDTVVLTFNASAMNSVALGNALRAGTFAAAPGAATSPVDTNTIYFEGSTTGELMQMICNRSDEINNADNTIIVLNNNLKADNAGSAYNSLFENAGVNINTSSLTINGNGNCIEPVDSSYTGSLMYLDGKNFAGVKNIVIANMTLKGASVTTTDDGALYVKNFGDNVTITGCEFSNNSIEYGGALNLLNEKAIDISNCTFSNNTADHVGVLYIDNTDALTIKGNLFADNELQDVIQIENSDSAEGEINYNSILGGGCYIPDKIDPSYNWFGSTEEDYRSKPIIGGVDVNNWIYLNITREVDEASGNYMMTASPMIYNSTSNNITQYDTWQLPTATLECGALYGASFNNGSSNIIMQESGCTPAVFGVDTTNSTYGVRVKVCGTNNVWDYVFTRTLDVDSNGQRIDYVPSGEYAAIPKENNEVVPHKLLENKDITATMNISYRGVDKNCTLTDVPIQCTTLTEDGLFNMSLADEYVARGDHNVTFAVDGFKSVQKTLHIDKTHTFIKCVNGTYSNPTVSNSTQGLTGIENFEQGQGGTIRFYVGNFFEDTVNGKMYIMNGTTDIAETDKILNMSSVSSSNQFAELDLNTLNKGSYDLVAVYHDDSSSAIFLDSNSSAQPLRFSVKSDASASVLGGNTTVNKAVGSASFGLNATVTDMGTPGTGTWTYTSSNEAVATVSDNGTVTVKGSGDANVTAKYESDSTAGKAQVTVHVISVTDPVLKMGLVYNGSDLTLLTAGSTEQGSGAVMKYRVGDTGAFDIKIPTAKEAGNYTVWYVIDGQDYTDVAPKAVGNVTIDQKTVGINWSDTSFTYDGNEHVAVANITGLADTDKNSVGVSVSGSNSSAGTHTATVTMLTGSRSGNYKLPTDCSKEFTVSPAGVTVTVNNVTIRYGESLPSLSASVTGLKGSDSASVISYTFDPITGIDAGNYTISASGNTLQGNYKVSFASGILTINKASQSAPSLSGSDETGYGKNDGMITGLTSAMEMSLTAYDSGYGTIADLSGKNLKPGTYYIRYMETANYEASPATVITINAALKPAGGNGNDKVTPDSGNNNNEGSDSNPPEGDYETFMNDLKAAAKKGSRATIVLNWGNSLSYEAMHILEENPQLTLIFNFKWHGVDYSATIGGGNRVIAVKSIPWYGPDYIKLTYGATVGKVYTSSFYTGNTLGSSGNLNEGTERYYVVKKGDSLWKIAHRILHVSVDYLVQKNNIRNRNKIHPGQKIYY